jgi:hypothetical protein
MQQSPASKSIRVRSQKVQGQRRDAPRILKGLTAGIAGGFVASTVMNQFQALWAKRIEGIEKSHGAQSLQQGSPRRGVARKLQERGSEEEQDDATERLASVVSDGLFRHKLTALEKDIAGTATHYGLGVAAGALYGIGVELAPSIRAGEGALFGALCGLLLTKAQCLDSVCRSG